MTFPREAQLYEEGANKMVKELEISMEMDMQTLWEWILIKLWWMMDD